MSRELLEQRIRYLLARIGGCPEEMATRVLVLRLFTIAIALEVIHMAITIARIS